MSDFAARVFSPQTLNRAHIFCDDSLVRKVGQFWLHFQEMTGLPLSSHILNDFRGFTTVTQLRDLASLIFLSKGLGRFLLAWGCGKGEQKVAGLIFVSRSARQRAHR